ncbi:peptidoglycan bridge formation glycyltransferase FemA/FemB family protein [Arenibacter lacus]|uniref:peptidoglycan bridge formation glycyltransferase FemA/FemB family protein n=1 Tax=Arenibacter lacus TaxID=2608629 RepID=UPI00123E3DD8|nr:peptidoglycan bridge formation glycyltransferase FemA/FemB family protein [Arenibacter lacus]
MIEIIKDRAEWSSLLGKVECYDFYHTYEYHLISKKQDEEPILLKYSESNILIAIPLLLRSIPNSNYKDCTSVYGYSGPISNNVDDNFDATAFASKFQTFLIENNIVTIFSRLNPFIPNQIFCIKGLGSISSLSEVVNIDITKDEEDQKKGYNKRLRTHVNKARRECYVREAATKEDIRQYIALYYDNMKRVNAKQEYFFGEEYFFELLNATDFNARILLALKKETNKIIAGAMFIESNKIVQYHLSGSDANFMHLYPIKLLIDEMRLTASRDNLIYFNLGGGVKNSKDSLFDFKASFSKDFKPFKVWRYIINNKVYEELVAKKQEKECAIFHKECSLFFPCYRCNI